MNAAIEQILFVMSIKDKQARELVVAGNNDDERVDNVQRANVIRAQISDLQTALTILTEMENS
jgi:hypothetical protein